MTREEYMGTLYSCLSALSPEERAAAMQYYTEYFDDAGAENERQVIEELGPPQEVAKQILKDFSFDRYPAPVRQPIRAQPGRPFSSWWAILLGVIALPILLPLAIAILAVLFGLALSAFIIVVAVGITAAVLIFAGFAGALGGVAHLAGWGFFPYYSQFPIGKAFISLGLGVLLLPLCWWIFWRGLPGLCRRVRLFWQGLRR